MHWGLLGKIPESTQPQALDLNVLCNQWELITASLVVSHSKWCENFCLLPIASYRGEGVRGIFVHTRQIQHNSQYPYVEGSL